MSRSRKYWLAWALPGIAVLLIAAVAIWWFRPASHPVTTTASLTNYPGLQIQPAFSPDGKQVAFAWDGEKRENFDIYVKAVGAGAPLRLTSNPAAEYHPAWSQDGRSIAFCRVSADHFEIWSISAQGGAERKLGESAVCEGLSWFPDGKYLALVDKAAPHGPNSILSLFIETGEKRRLTSPANELLGDLSPRLSPDGTTLAFRRASSSENNDVYVLRIGAGGNV
jgi:Tol biopolymer transport system component